MQEFSNYYKLSKTEQEALIKSSGLNLEDTSTWTEKNCSVFMEKHPYYKVDFEVTINNKNCSIDKNNIIIYAKGFYSTKIAPNVYGGYSYSELKAKANNIPAISPEQPINLRCYDGIFRECYARRIIVPGWDISKAWSARELFHDNKCVEEIEMIDWKYPNNVDAKDFCFFRMFAGCEKLRRLRLKTPDIADYWYLDPAVKSMFYMDCFKDCKNLEFVYFCKGSGYVVNCIRMIIEASEKQVTIDGVFKYRDLLEINGGYEIESVNTSNNSSNIKLHLVKKPGIEGISFCGKCIADDVEEKKRKADRLYKNNMISMDDYYMYKGYLASIKTV